MITSVCGILQGNRHFYWWGDKTCEQSCGAYSIRGSFCLSWDLNHGKTSSGPRKAIFPVSMCCWDFGSTAAAKGQKRWSGLPAFVNLVLIHQMQYGGGPLMLAFVCGCFMVLRGFTTFNVLEGGGALVCRMVWWWPWGFLTWRWAPCVVVKLCVDET